MDVPLPAADHQHRRWWVGAVGARLVLGLAALPLTPLLLRDGLATLLLLRPAREFLVLAGFRVRADQMELPLVVLAALPMLLLGNWVFFGLGRAYRDGLDDGLPDWLQRSFEPEQIARLRAVLAHHGTPLIVLARLAIFPVTLLAAATGASPMSTRRFLLADTLGTALSLAQYIGIGYLLGRASESRGLWIAVVGGAGLIAMLIVFGRALRATEQIPSPDPGPEPPDPPDVRPGEDAPEHLGRPALPDPDTSSA